MTPSGAVFSLLISVVVVCLLSITSGAESAAVHTQAMGWARVRAREPTARSVDGSEAMTHDPYVTHMTSPECRPFWRAINPTQLPDLLFG